MDLGAAPSPKVKDTMNPRNGRRRSISPHASITEYVAYISTDLADTFCLLSRSRLIFPALASIES